MWLAWVLAGIRGLDAQIHHVQIRIDKGSWGRHGAHNVIHSQIRHTAHNVTSVSLLIAKSTQTQNGGHQEEVSADKCPPRTTDIPGTEHAPPWMCAGQQRRRPGHVAARAQSPGPGEDTSQSLACRKHTTPALHACRNVEKRWVASDIGTTSCTTITGTLYDNGDIEEEQKL